jgi:spore coat protein SA
LFVGRLSDKKGPHVLIHAMQHVVRRIPGAALLLVGSKWFGANRVDSYGEMLRTMASRVSARVIFVGYVPTHLVQEYFWVADLLVCPSQWQEPLARVHYEAMAAGLPIVTTCRGGNPEVVSGFGNGLTVQDYFDPEVIAAAICQILSDPAADEMGRQGRKLAETRFSWDRVAHELTSVYDQALAGAQA